MLIAGAVLAGVLLLIWRGNLFMALRLRLNDTYFVQQATSGNLVIVAIDDASLAAYGRAPAEWPRRVYADLLNALAGSGARVVAIDLLFSGEAADDALLVDALAALREAGTRIVLANAGINSVAAMREQGDLAALQFSTDLSLSPVIADAAALYYRGYANTIPDIDGVIRRQPSLITVLDEAPPDSDFNDHFSFSLATYLAYLRIPAGAASQVLTAEPGALMVAGRRLSVDAFGLWQLNYFGPPSSPPTEQPATFPTISLAAIIDQQVDLSQFAGKIVLVGLINTTGLLEQYQVPASTRGDLMAGIEIQANAIESLLQDRAVSTLPDSWQAVLIVGLALAASLIYALPRWYIKVMWAFGLVLVWFFSASATFSTALVMINLFDTSLALILPLGVAIGTDIIRETRLRQRKEFLLDSLRHVAEQRLHIEQIADYILTDLARLVPGAQAALDLHLDGDSCRRFTHDPQRQWPDASAPTAADDSATIIRRDPYTFVPIQWQGRRQGVMLLAHPRRLSGASQRLLAEFAQQLAPHIDNLTLYYALQRQKSLLDSVFAESPAGIAISDDAGQIIQCNDALAPLFDEPDSAQSTLLELLRKADDPLLLKRFKDGLASGAAFHFDDVPIGAVSLRIGAAPLRGYGLWTVVLVDVTALVDLSKLKTKMLRLASHDLKNPLSRVSGYAELIDMNGGLSETNQRYLSYIQSAGVDMLNIINDILSLERLRSSKIAAEPVNLSLLVRDVCGSHQPDVIRKQQHFTLELQADDLHVQGDPGQLSQAITNLVGNAIKYTPDAGTIVVRLNADDATLHFAVEDTGYGIPLESQADLFSEFFRAVSTATSHIEGTGLGLSLTKSVIEGHGGTIGFTSIESEGSTFYFTLPRFAPYEPDDQVDTEMDDDIDARI
ncbi:MAG: CHASE2 domain-containing protein [Chloroflexi bacterium]|nr:CHASE2 domain-containing protein [Chloroflexota bacterium]